MPRLAAALPNHEGNGVIPVPTDKAALRSGIFAAGGFGFRHAPTALPPLTR